MCVAPVFAIFWRNQGGRDIVWLQNGTPMILRFAVENFRSFRERVELSFVATRITDAPDWRMPAPGAPHGVLPVVGVFGANASGKSNLVKAFQTLRKHVERSFHLKPGGLIPWSPFQMRRGEGDPPTTFEVDFLVNGVRHHYGLRHTAAAFTEEWLYRWPGRTRQVLFTRDHAAADGWYFGPELKGGKRAIAEATRANALFLSTASQLNHEQLGPVAAVLTQGCEEESEIELRGYPLFDKSAPLLQPLHEPVVRRVLEAADIGVAGFNARPMRTGEVPPEAVAELKTTLTEEAFARWMAALSDGERPLEVWLQHHGGDGTTWELPPDLESSGTQVLLSRINDLLPVLEHGRMLVIDELDTSLHPDLCCALLGLFTSAETNPKGAQLLFSTHDRDLLSHLRRDEVVLVDKGRDGVSTLAYGSDFDGVRGREDLRRVHAQGRIGGVPALGDLRGAWQRLVTHGP